MFNKLKLKLNVLAAFPEPVEEVFPDNQYWPELVHRGQVWRARMNDTILKFRNGVLILLVLSLSADIAINTIGVYQITNWLSKKEASFMERWMLSPIASTKEVFEDEPVDLQFSGTPIASNDDMSSATEVNVLPAFIDKNILSLNSESKLAYECDNNWDAQQSWAYQNRFDVPKCKTVNNEIWIGSLVSQGPRSYEKKLLLGVFRKVDGVYKFWNVQLPANGYPTYAVPGYQTVSAEMITKSFSKAFPELVKGEKK